MKQLLTLLICLAATAAIGQTRVKASEIIQQINQGRAVEYTDAEIEGDLDLTDLQNRRLDRSDMGWLGFGGNETYESVVEVPLKFTNCTFLGDVLAYYHIERRHETYVAHFDEAVVFANCTFRGDSEFKYSEFNASASFSGTTFYETANFKYAEFSRGPLFAGVKFDRGADFKYAEFPRETSFERATFFGLANFKYSKFNSPLHMKGVDFRGSEDFKYTKIDGRSFTSFLLDDMD